MIESAGAYGPWFEWGRVAVEQKPTREQLLSLGDEDLVNRDTRLYLQRYEYRRKCQELFSGLSIMNHAMEDAVAIRCNEPKIGDGLILRATFKDWETARKDKLALHAFLITPNAIYKIGHLTPKTLEKTEKAEVGFRLSRLALVNDRIWMRDILLDDKRSDAELLDRAIRISVDAAKKKVSLEKYTANFVSLN